jgi:16S rRNA (cytosine967-C5)-methyltransferase
MTSSIVMTACGSFNTLHTMKYFSYLNTATEIIDAYSGQQPFQLFIKDFFKQHKKYGSTDRKQVGHLCYSYFRLGKSLQHLPVPDKILTAVFLCSNENNELLQQLKPAWHEKINLPLDQKLILLDRAAEDLAIFPCINQLSPAIDKNSFERSHLVQPDFFLRIRPGRQQQVIKKLEQSGIPFLLDNDNCIRLPNASKADSILDINKDAVVQDYNSQRTGDLLRLVSFDLPRTWDCCAASGGKSIMAKDILGNIDLTVSDIREQIIVNLKKRLSEAGLSHYKTMVADLSGSFTHFKNDSFQLIIADLPCTGSGTWGRTPERLSFFDEKEIDYYQQLQKKIITNVLPCLQKNGYLLYITCSVFKKENEDMMDFISASGATVVKAEVLKGYQIKADTMFAALMRK